MSNILENSKAVILPSGGRGGETFSPKTVAGALTLYRELLGNQSVREAI